MSSKEKKTHISECEEFLRIKPLFGDIQRRKIPGDAVMSRWFKYVQRIFLRTEVPVYPMIQNCSLQMWEGMWGRTTSLNPGNIKLLSPGCSLSLSRGLYYAEHLQTQVFPQEDADVQYSWGFILIILIATAVVCVLSPETTCGGKSNNYSVESRCLK